MGNIKGKLFIGFTLRNLLAYQNCSKIAPQDLQFKNSDGSLTLVEGSGFPTSPDDNPGSPLNPVDEDGVRTPPIDVPPTYTDKPKTDTPETDEPDEIESIAQCLNDNYKESLSGESFYDLKGKNQIVSDDIDLIDGGSGNLLVKPKSDHGSIAKLSHRGGHTVLCNMDIDEISDTNGNIVLVNCHVGKISNHKGIVKSVYSTIENPTSQKSQNVKGYANNE
jgi:hypothetical protein